MRKAAQPMVPEDVNEIAPAIEAALARFRQQAAADRTSLAADRSLPPATRDAGIAAIDAMGERADDLLRILQGRTSADASDRSVT